MKIELANRLNGIGEYYFSKKLTEIGELNKSGQTVINLGIGSPDLPPHPSVIETLAMEAAKANVHAYQSYKGAEALRNAFATWYKKMVCSGVESRHRNSAIDWFQGRDHAHLHDLSK